MKQCKIDNCNNNVFTHGYCKNHSYIYYNEKGSSTVVKTSEKRQIEQRHYEQIRAKLMKDLKASGQWTCFFCGLPLGENADAHHLLSRTGELFTDKDSLVFAHNECHVHIWHSKPFSFVCTLSWFPSFMERLRVKNHDLWMKYNYKLEELSK